MSDQSDWSYTSESETTTVNEGSSDHMSVNCKSKSDQSEQQDSQETAAQNKVEVEKPEVHDIVFGRGRPFQQHAGNRRMQKIVERNRHRYKIASRNDKTPVTKQVYLEIMDYPHPIRFLKQIDTQGEEKVKKDLKGPWYEVDEKEALGKVAHGLRGKKKNKSAVEMQKRKSKKHRERMWDNFPGSTGGLFPSHGGPNILSSQDFSLSNFPNGFASVPNAFAAQSRNDFLSNSNRNTETLNSDVDPYPSGFDERTIRNPSQIPGFAQAFNFEAATTAWSTNDFDASRFGDSFGPRTTLAMHAPEDPQQHFMSTTDNARCFSAGPFNSSNMQERSDSQSAGIDSIGNMLSTMNNGLLTRQGPFNVQGPQMQITKVDSSHTSSHIHDANLGGEWSINQGLQQCSLSVHDRDATIALAVNEAKERREVRPHYARNAASLEDLAAPRKPGRQSSASECQPLSKELSKSIVEDLDCWKDFYKKRNDDDSTSS